MKAKACMSNNSRRDSDQRVLFCLKAKYPCYEPLTPEGDAKVQRMKTGSDNEGSCDRTFSGGYRFSIHGNVPPIAGIIHTLKPRAEKSVILYG